MNVVKILIGITVMFLGFIYLLGVFIGPDDLRGCGTTPGEKPQCVKADVIVALSGGDTQARAAEAITLYKNGWADTIVFSGAAADKTGPSNARVMEQQALDAGVLPDAIVVEELSETTTENADQVKNIFEQRGITDAIIVTSAYHTRRAGLEFRQRASGVNVRVHTAPNDHGWGPLWWLTPYGWVTAIGEAVSSAVLSTGGVDRTNDS